jgi:endonuclease/exonuclease/phosphatase (EEP) superfamily protein YafD
MAISLAGTLGLAATLGAVLLPVHHYRLDLLSHFAPHTMLAGMATMLIAAAGRFLRLTVLIGLLTLALALASIARYDAWRPDPPPEGESLTVRVIVYNAFARGAARVGSELDKAFREWAAEVDADLICLVDPPWSIDRSGLWNKEQLPYALEREARGRASGRDFGITLLSRWPVRLEPLADRLRPENRLSFLAHSSVIVEHPSGAGFLFTGAHPRSPRTERTWELSFRWMRVDARLLREWMEANPLPVIFAGDFNTTPTARLHALIRRETSLRSPTQLLTQGTWPSWAPPGLALPIDRAWISPGSRVTDVRVGPIVNSDHRPVMIEVQLPAVLRDETQSDQ